MLPAARIRFQLAKFSVSMRELGSSATISWRDSINSAAACGGGGCVLLALAAAAAGGRSI
jgi:hypothetical protein